MPAWLAGYDREREILVVEVTTNGGLVGLGYQLYLRDGFRTVRACIEDTVIPAVVGRHASEVEWIWRELYFGNVAHARGGTPIFAQSAIDVALWDLIGQAAGMPLHRLWGHYRAQIPVYGSGVWRGLGGEDMGLLDDIWVTWAKPVDGVITAPETPGHGLRIKPEVMKEYAID